MILALAALLPWSVMAQDGRQRTASTVIADAMAQLPASKQETFNQVMSELAAVGSDAVVQIAICLSLRIKARMQSWNMHWMDW